MKITCQSCASKYTIADEKVAGKTVKIKCKKCGATIVVNGNDVGFQAAPTADPYAQQSVPPEEGAPEEGDGQTSVFTGEQGGAPGGSGGDWTVNVADNDQRTMSSAQLAEAYTAGIVNNDTYVWKDGMGDWSPFSDVPELMALTRKSAPAAAPMARPAAGFSPPAPAAPAVGLAGTMMMDQAPPAAAAAPVPVATPAAARRAVQRETADPFQAREQQVAAATPPPKIDRSVGERNENSMLFSISALTAAKDARDHDRAGPIGGGGGGGGGGRNGGRGGVDDIMNLGGGMAAAPILAPPPLLAPVVEAPPPPPMAHAPMMQGAPPQYGGMPAAMPGHMAMPEDNPYARKKSPVGLIIGIVGGLALVGGALFFFMGRPDPNATTTPDQAAVTGTPTQTAAPTTPTAAPVETQVAAADTAAPATTGAEPGGGAPKPGVGTNPGAPGPGPGTGPGPKPTAAPTTAPTTEPTPAKPVETAPPAAEGAEFNRGAATSALGAAAGAAKGCKKPDGPTGSGRVKVTFAPSGNVTSAVVDGPPFAGTPVGGCVASAFRSARVPPFTGAPVTVSKSFNIN